MHFMTHLKHLLQVYYYKHMLGEFDCSSSLELSNLNCFCVIVKINLFHWNHQRKFCMFGNIKFMLIFIISIRLACLDFHPLTNFLPCPNHRKIKSNPRSRGPQIWLLTPLVTRESLKELIWVLLRQNRFTAITARCEESAKTLKPPHPH